MRFEDVVRRLERLPAELPDPPEALIPVFAETGAPRPRPPWDEAAGTGRPAAVLILVYPDADGEARVVLTERADRGGHHSGEVSFPGGRAEAEDADLVATALREANEEVGLDAAAEGVRVLGTLAGPLDPRLELRGDAGRSPSRRGGRRWWRSRPRWRRSSSRRWRRSCPTRRW